jgi:3-oxoisoapionate decarboxylase
LDIELEGSTRSIFTPIGSTPGDQAAELRRDIDTARAVGMTVMRSGYGRLTIETSRFDLGTKPSEHRRHMVACLAAAAKVAEDAEFPLAVENHCDLHGRELAEILAEVDSPYIGAALDTGNGFTVYCDPQDDIDALAPYTFTTHMKDMRVEQSPIRGTIPFLPRGCGLG